MQNDMKSIIQAAVAEAVEKTLGRQLEMQERQVELLERIAQFLGVEPGRAPAASVQRRPPAPVPTAKRASAPAPAPASTPATKRTPSVPVRKYVRPEAAPKPTRAGPASKKSRGRPRAAGRTAPAAASSPSPETPVSFAVGQEVRYKQGRGAFNATVKAVDENAKTLTLARVSDGKQVVRPFDKVTPA
jgi:hypothetical protein